jgi:hypothetical protein
VSLITRRERSGYKLSEARDDQETPSGTAGKFDIYKKPAGTHSPAGFGLT